MFKVNFSTSVTLGAELSTEGSSCRLTHTQPTKISTAAIEDNKDAAARCESVILMIFKGWGSVKDSKNAID